MVRVLPGRQRAKYTRTTTEAGPSGSALTFHTVGAKFQGGTQHETQTQTPNLHRFSHSPPVNAKEKANERRKQIPNRCGAGVLVFFAFCVPGRHRVSAPHGPLARGATRRLRPSRSGIRRSTPASAGTARRRLVLPTTVQMARSARWWLRRHCLRLQLPLIGTLGMKREVFRAIARPALSDGESET